MPDQTRPDQTRPHYSLSVFVFVWNLTQTLWQVMGWLTHKDDTHANPNSLFTLMLLFNQGTPICFPPSISTTHQSTTSHYTQTNWRIIQKSCGPCESFGWEVGSKMKWLGFVRIKTDGLDYIKGEKFLFFNPTCWLVSAHCVVAGSWTFGGVCSILAALHHVLPSWDCVNLMCQYPTCLFICSRNRRTFNVNHKFKVHLKARRCLWSRRVIAMLVAQNSTSISALPCVIVAWQCATSLQGQTADGTNSCCLQMAAKRVTRVNEKLSE